MSVDTKKIRAYVEEYLSYAHGSDRERGLKATMGVRAGDLLQLLDVYDVAQRWCRRPASVLTNSASNVLQKDQEMWLLLRAAVNGEKP